MAVTWLSNGQRARPRRRWAVVGLVLVSLVAVSCDLGPQTAFTVTTTVDAVDAAPGDGVCEVTLGADDCSLRAAVQEANAFAGDATITLGAGATYALTIPGPEAGPTEVGDLDITGHVAILGQGATVDGGQIDRVFDVAAGATLSLDRITVTGGVAPYGGGIANAGTLSVSNSTITGNEANGYQVCDTFVISTTCDSGRGGGGGIDSEGTVSIWSSTIEGNRSVSPSCNAVPHFSTCYVQSGAGLNVSGTAGLVNVTISGNEEVNGDGAALAASGSATIVYSTIADNVINNTPTTGGIIIVLPGNAVAGNLTLGSSVLADPATPADSVCKGTSALVVGTTITSQGHNVFGDHSCPTASLLPSDRQDTDGGLSPLADNGGPTRTQLPGAPLIDQVPATDLLCSSLTDQRGVARPVGGACDIGAVEGA